MDTYSKRDSRVVKGQNCLGNTGSLRFADAVSTLNINSWEAKIFGRYWHHLALPEHCSFYSPEVLVKYLEESGFTPKKVIHGYLTGGFGNSFIGYLKEKGHNWLLNFSQIFLLLGIPFEIISSIFRKSGLITIVCEPNKK